MAAGSKTNSKVTAGSLGMLKLNPQLYKAHLLVTVSLFAMVLSFFHGVAWFPSLYFSKDLSNTIPDTEIHNRWKQNRYSRYSPWNLTQWSSTQVTPATLASMSPPMQKQLLGELRGCKDEPGEPSSQPDDASSHTSPFSTFQRFQYALFYIPIFKIFQVSVQHSPIYLTHFQNIFTLYISFFDFLCIPWTSMSNGVHEACCGGSPTCSRALIRLISAQPRKLYSEIVRIDPERAGRITGMMLEILGGFSNSINL